jgi:hypothetical protein
MSLVTQCDRCRSQNSVLSTRRFASGIDVTVTQQQEQAPTHLCLDCIAESLLDALVSLEGTPTARDYAEAQQKAADCSRAYAMAERTAAERDEMKERLAEARSSATAAGQYQGWLKERAELHQKIEALEAARDVALTRAAQAEKNAAEVVKRAQAAATQAKADEKDDPEYVKRVAAREATRASGRPG